MAALHPGFVAPGQIRDPARLFFGEVVEFGAVGSKIIKFPWAFVLGHELEVAGPNSAIALMLPEQVSGRLVWTALKIGNEGATFAERGRLETGSLSTGWHEVDEMTGCVIEAIGLELVAPGGNERR